MAEGFLTVHMEDSKYYEMLALIQMLSSQFFHRRQITKRTLSTKMSPTRRIEDKKSNIIVKMS